MLPFRILCDYSIFYLRMQAFTAEDSWPRNQSASFALPDAGRRDKILIDLIFSNIFLSRLVYMDEGGERQNGGCQGP